MADVDGLAAQAAGLSFEDAVASKKPYYEKRIALFEQYASRERDAVEKARAAGAAIKVVLPDGAVKQGIKGVTTPMDVANEISKSLAKKVVVAKVDGEDWDLLRPLLGDCALSLHNFDDPEGREVRASTHGS
jgi:threonyl-tRNA synthetase